MQTATNQNAMEDHVLLSWADLRSDPYNVPHNGNADRREPGPTLTLLFDPESPYRGCVHRVVLFYRKPDGGPRPHEDFAAADATRKEIERLSGSRNIDAQSGPKIEVELVPWAGDDPTDHRAIFDFLSEEVRREDERSAGQHLLVHISPGTPPMQTIWVLMGEMGLLREPFTVVKSLRRAYRRGRPAVVPVRLDIPTFYKAFQHARPTRVSAPEEMVLLDPKNFESDRLKQLYAEAGRYARLNVPVLILGERGTGKTTLASWIRSNSPFRNPNQDGSWPSVPCSQYSTETMRAELFGYVKGAFTDARKDTVGLLHAADGDTLFLDEIGDISKDLQRMLIRALEEKRFTRVGAQVAERSDFRLVTATNLPWEELSSRLDPDFLDRISVLVLEMPALREIREDLPWLWRHVYLQSLRRARVAPSQMRITEEDHERIVERLRTHRLPGNLRDLFRVAYELVAAGVDDGFENPVTFALSQGLTRRVAHGVTPLRAIAEAFAAGEPLDHLAGTDPIPTRTLEKALKRYLAEELRRIATSRGLRPEDLCDVTDRTLQLWVKYEA